MKPGDLVRQAANIFANRTIGGDLMLVISTTIDHHNAVIDVLHGGTIYRFHAGELEYYDRFISTGPLAQQVEQETFNL